MEWAIQFPTTTSASGSMPLTRRGGLDQFLRCRVSLPHYASKPLAPPHHSGPAIPNPQPRSPPPVFPLGRAVILSSQWTQRPRPAPARPSTRPLGSSVVDETRLSMPLHGPPRFAPRARPSLRRRRPRRENTTKRRPSKRNETTGSCTRKKSETGGSPNLRRWPIQRALEARLLPTTGRRPDRQLAVGSIQTIVMPIQERCPQPFRSWRARSMVQCDPK